MRLAGHIQGISSFMGENSDIQSAPSIMQNSTEQTVVVNSTIQGRHGFGGPSSGSLFIFKIGLLGKV